MSKMNDTKIEDTNSPIGFVQEAIRKFQEEQKRDPVLILASVDLLRDIGKEIQRNTGRKRADLLSITLMLKNPIKILDIEIAVVGGKKRMAII